MDTFVAVVFGNETQAYKGAEALDDLSRNGDVVVYSTAVIGKDNDGQVSIKPGCRAPNFARPPAINFFLKTCHF